MQPNIVYILSDQHHPGVWGGAGDPYVSTPHMDALAAAGVSLEDCSCASPLCVPSRSALMCGLSPVKTGIYNNMQALPFHVPTFAHSLANAGYETVLCGRMHFVGYDQHHGFQTRLVGDITETYPFNYRLFMEKQAAGKSLPKNRPNTYGPLAGTSGPIRRAIELSGGGDSAVLHFDRDVTDAAVDFLRTRRDGRPLLLTVGLYGPHCPYVAPEALFKKYYDLLPPYPSVTPEDVRAMHPAMQQWITNRHVENLTPEDVRRVRAAYYAMVEYTDTLLGEVLTAARETLGEENTVFIYGSDHGDCLGEHGYFWKSNLFDSSVRVPMVYCWKDHFPAGTTLRAPTTLLDLAPTLTELAGAAPLPDADGRSLLADLTAGASAEEDRYIFSFCSDIKGDTPSAMVKDHRYKLVLFSDFPPMLFDLENDPREETNLAGRPELQDVEEDLTRRLRAMWDPQQAKADLAREKARVPIINQWFTEADLPAETDWPGQPEWNHIDCKTS